ncbi:MAG: hypothetical protein ACPG4Z_03115 [Chitinophagales bacterium]
MSTEKTYTEDQAHRFFGAKYNNEIFALYEKETLTKYERERIIHLGHASLLHWQDFSGHKMVNTQRGLYMIAKAYLKADEKENAMKYAQECHQLTFEQQNEMADFDLAYASEIMMRVNLLLGNENDAKKYKKDLVDYSAKIKNEEDLKWMKKDTEDLV